jgi:hypothetical protein
MRKSGRTAGREANMGRKDKMGQAELRKHLCCNQGGNAIKFTKRIGERGEDPRPLLTGFYTEDEKVLVLNLLTCYLESRIQSAM